ncbi:MAG: NUDIX hydrolase [Thermoplasmata archaeon]|nr:NUDIX hydrolase [Thermoplasmata archaeon]MCI4358818.1 NUDIX hydrolase [Thermoplasmata archaeon]
MRYPAGPKLTVDAVWVRRGSLLLVQRGRPPFVGRWALPGGFVDPTETVEEAVVRELREETGLRARPEGIVGVFSGPNRDPRGPTASVAFWMKGRGGSPQGGDDARNASWVPIDQAVGLAFDHDRIVREALRRFCPTSRS